MIMSTTNEDLRHSDDTVERLTDRSASIEPSSLDQLEQRRQSAYHTADRYTEKKRSVLVQQKPIHQKKELDHLRSQLDQLIDHSDHRQKHYDSIHRAVQLAEAQINELEHHGLPLRSSNIHDEHLMVHRCLFPLSPPYQTILLKAGVESALGTNDQHLLVDREGKHLCLLDRDLTLIKETPVTHSGIRGICWASAIARFILITFTEVLLLDEKTMNLEACPIPWKGEWWRGTCSNESLFLSTVEWGSAVYEFNLRSSFEKVQEWRAPITCGKDEIICDLKYNSNYLAMPIYNRQKDDGRLELRSALTLDPLWSVQIHGRSRCCPVDVDQWLVMDCDDRRFFHISADGELLEEDKSDQHERLEDIAPWGTNDIVVLTKKNVHFHKFT